MSKENLKIKLSEDSEQSDEEIIFIPTYARTQLEYRLDYFCDEYYDDSENEQ
jgi:hypothetical protein